MEVKKKQQQLGNEVIAIQKKNLNKLKIIAEYENNKTKKK